MAQKQKQKRPSPLDEPPTASSSDSSEEEEIPSSQPHPEEQEEDDEEVSSEEQEEDDDDDEEEEEQHQPPSKNPPPPPAKAAPSDSHTASGSDSGSESDSPAATPVYKVKPIASKPIEQTTPKPNSKAQPSASKRPAENNDNGHANDAKRSKKQKVTDAPPPSDDDEAEEDAKKSGADSRNPFQRLWSEEDEIAILKGMVDFTSKTGADPFKHANAFHDFMKKTLHADASSNQLKEKIRRLKKKFETNAGKGKNGQDPTFSKPHDQESFELSKKVWGNEEGGAGGGEGGGKANGAVEKPKSNGKSAKSPKKKASKMIVVPSKPKPELKHELTSKDSKDAVKMDIDEKIDTTSQLLEVVRADKGVGLYGLSEDVVKRGMGLIGASERAELERLWKELQAAELEVSVKRAELVAKQARLILEANKSSNY